MTRTNHDLTAVSLFSGAGGLDLGLEAAGWAVAFQADFDADCVETLRLNALRGGTSPEILHSAVEDPEVLSGISSAVDGAGGAVLLAGGPPCQPFTTSGLRQSIEDARASSLFPAYLSILDDLRPDAVLIENVDGMLSAALRHRPLAQRGTDSPPLSSEETKGSFLHWLLGELTARGFAVSWGVAEAADYGVPQMRQRSILIGVQGKQPCFLPPPAFGGDGLPPFRTLKDALGDLDEIGAVQPLSKRKRAIYEQIPPGGNWRDLSSEEQMASMGAAYYAEGGRSGWWRRLGWDMPAPTVLGMPDHSSTALIHPDQSRCLSVYECAAVQSFPSWVRFSGTARSQYQQIGNAVPPLLGEAVAGHIAAYLSGERVAVPSPPAWRKASANRRIGTHGWAVPGPKGQPQFTLNVKVRPDHIWKRMAGVEFRD